MPAEKQHYDGHLITFSSNTGYPTIHVGGKNVLLHRYIWEKYHGVIPDGYEIHHKDKNRHNYDPDNLELVSIVDHHRNHALEQSLGKSNKGKRKDHVSGFCGIRRPVVADNGLEVIQFDSISEAARKLKIHHGDISRILKGTRKTARGWVFKYVTT